MTRRQGDLESVDQYAADILVLFHHLSRVGDQNPKIVKAQIFVQGLRPDLLMFVQQFIPTNNTALNMMVALLQLPQIVPSPILQIETPVTLVKKNPVEQMPVKSCQRKKEEEMKSIDFSVIENLDNKVKKTTSVKELRKQDFEESKNDEQDPEINIDRSVPSERAYNQQNYSDSGKEKHKKDTPGKHESKQETSNNDEPAPTFSRSFHCYQNEIGVEKKEWKTPNIHQTSKKTDHNDRTCRVEGKNNLGNSYQNGIGIEKYKPKTFNNYQKPIDMGHTGTTWGLERYCQNDIGITKTESKVKIYLPIKDHFDGTDNPKTCDEDGIRAEENGSNRIVVERRKPTAEKEPPKRKKDGKSLDDTCRVWVLKVENIRSVKLVKEEEMSTLNVLPCKVGDEIPVEPEWYDKGHERNTVTNEITIKSQSWCRRWKTTNDDALG
ncbi:hypothetical protein C2G38_2170089 [Gigaspora rosea]|uniref:Uncharacterized protein n=1 Tax=Gigaspora rosea TaxID=44941 RepID=A0A397VMW7_9GLOM|nr:hypothetical protein C2G38_2170089 [Gigaspora rosea]